MEVLYWVSVAICFFVVSSFTTPTFGLLIVILCVLLRVMDQQCTKH